MEQKDQYQFFLKLLDLENDFFRHIATLDTAVIVVMATLFDKAGGQVFSKPLAVTVIASIAVSLGAVLFSQALLMIPGRYDLEEYIHHHNTGLEAMLSSMLMLIAGAGLFIGVLSIGVFWVLR